MRRIGNRFELIPEWENLRLAFQKAARSKRSRPDVQQFVSHLDERLKRLQQQLVDGTMVFGRYRQFVLFDPKERIITAPCFEERVVHHAIINVCEPDLDRWLISDTFACRTGKGRERAIVRAQQFARRFPYFLKIDIRKYFDSISHGRLLDRLERFFKDRRLLPLLGQIIRAFRGNQEKGLPIGSLTSQHFANFYLGWFDRYIKEVCRVKGYVRYMDDMAFWAEDSGQLRALLDLSQRFLEEELGLQVKAHPYINQSARGMEFLGSRLFPYHALLTRTGRKRYRRKLLALMDAQAQGELTELQVQQRYAALAAFTRAAGIRSWKFRNSVLNSEGVKRHEARTG